MPKYGYSTTVTAPDGTTVDLGVQSYTFTNGNSKKSEKISSTVTTETDSFTFHSSEGNTEYVGANKNDEIVDENDTAYPDVSEVIVFTNTADEVIPSPTKADFNIIPFAVIFAVGLILVPLAIRRKKYRLW